jgi:methylated-DNA-[protein]-cysteine S-methyltransferase
VNRNEDAMNLCLSEHPTPLGPLTMVTRGDALCVAAFSNHADHAEGLVRALSKRYPDLRVEPGAAPRAVTEAFLAYWGGELGALDAMAVEPSGTAFQARIWAALREIPAGTTIAYAELSRRVGSPGASRAAGSANGANPVSIVIPCHRVIRGDGDLCGYAGGVPRKRWLLEHERHYQAP